MGQLIKGEWFDEWYDTSKTGGRFVRSDAAFRSAIGDEKFPAESGRYHLYVSLACPWAHRTLIFRKLKGLDAHIDVSVVDPLMLENGWEFQGEDPLYGHNFLYQIYTHAKRDYTGRVTVPVLWDKKNEMIVSNESAEIIRMFNSAFNEITGDEQDFYPEDLRAEINEINSFVYPNINNGVYRAGFATTQEAYEEAFHQLFDALDQLEARLAEKRYLCGELTEADWRLFTTLIRFDAVYYGHFKCNKRQLEDYPNLSNYVRDLYQFENVSETVNFEHIKRHYYGSHPTINPYGIVPEGPMLDYSRPHNRAV